MDFDDDQKTLLKELEDEAYAEEKQQFKDQYLKVMESLLMQVFPAQYVKDNLEYHLTGEGEEICSRQPDQRDLSPEEEARRSEILKAVNRLHKMYLDTTNNMFHTCYLFLNAPWESRRRDLDEDQAANTLQNQTMYDIMHVGKHKDRNPKAEVVVKTQTEIKHAIKQTFAEMAMKTRRITIIFNGEGSDGTKADKGSLCLHGDQPMSMDKFINEILSSWNGAIEEEAKLFITNEEEPIEEVSTTQVVSMDTTDSIDTTPPLKRQYHAQASSDVPQLDYKKVLDTIPPFPSDVSVVFGQCHSHNCGSEHPLKSDWGSKFDIFPLTRPDVRDGKAVCGYHFEPLVKIPGVTRMLISSNHNELNHFAKQYAKRMGTIKPSYEPCWTID